MRIAIAEDAAVIRAGLAEILADRGEHDVLALMAKGRSGAIADRLVVTQGTAG
jgi:DNA-binding NarL/FixJ family response regulator